MIISPAFAQSGGGGMGGLESLLPLVLIFVVFYFLLIRPQQKKQKQHRQMLEALRRGDRVVTAGGIIGTITKASETELTVEITDGVKVKVMRGLISDVLAKTESRDTEDDKDEDKESKKINNRQ
ncbi:MAG: preprotein translocase subunit YajC [Rhodospirillales bacterium]|nr:preprotein translocase subunit YajC [Rhodospirillales bacterium]